MKKFSVKARFVGLVIPALIGIASSLARAQEFSAILSSPLRPPSEQALDASRKPGEVLKFYGVKPGDKVADLMAGGGYYTVILSLLVGDKGLVYSANPTLAKELKERFQWKELKERFQWKELKERFQDPALANVKLIEGGMESVALPADGALDFVLIHLNYHDLPSASRTAMNQRVLKALKPGGVYGVVDHAAKDGSGNQVATTLHRIDRGLVIKEVNDAGFLLVKDSDMLRNPSDPRTENVFNNRGTSDRFVLSFQKPK